MAEKRKDSKGRILRDNERQRSDGKYEYRYYFAGQLKSIYAWKLVPTDKTPVGKREDLSLREKIKQIEHDLKDGIDTNKGNITLHQLFEMYMSTKTDLKESTRCNYMALWNNTVKDSMIGNMKISQIKKIHVKAFYSDLVKQGLSANTVKLFHNLIFPALEMAVDSDMIRKNPAKDARKGVGGTKKEREALTATEQEKLLDFIAENDHYKLYYPMIVIALNTALRVGELTALQWSDIDMKNNVLHVRRQLLYKNLGDGCNFRFQSLKTEAGKRDIPLTPQAKKCLQQIRELDLMLGREAVRKEVAGANNFVFINSNGNPFATNGVNFVLRNIVNAYNKQEEEQAKKQKRASVLLPHISAHILRHTACTRLAEGGIDPKVLQVIMGHSDIGVTMNVYNHVDNERIMKEIERVSVAM